MSNNYFSHLLLFCLLCVTVCTAESSDIALHKAVLKNDVERVKTLLGQGVTPEQRDSKERTPLFRAAHRGYAEIIRILLAANADPNALDKWGNTPLFEAAQQGQLESVNLLLTSGARIDVLNLHTETPLLAAVRNNHAPVATQLLRKNADPNIWAEGKAFAPLHYAAMREDTDLLAVLLDAGAQVNAKGELGATPLHIAAAHGRASAVELLLTAGADITAQADNGSTPLHYSVAFGSTNVATVVSSLLRNGASTDVVDGKGKTPIDLSKEKGSEPSVISVFEGHISTTPSNILTSYESPIISPTTGSSPVSQEDARNEVAPPSELPVVELEPSKDQSNVQNASTIRKLLVVAAILAGLIVVGLFLRHRQRP